MNRFLFGIVLAPTGHPVRRCKFLLVSTGNVDQYPFPFDLGRTNEEQKQMGKQFYMFSFLCFLSESLPCVFVTGLLISDYSFKTLFSIYCGKSPSDNQPQSNGAAMHQFHMD